MALNHKCMARANANSIDIEYKTIMMGRKKQNTKNSWNYSHYYYIWSLKKFSISASFLFFFFVQSSLALSKIWNRHLVFVIRDKFVRNWQIWNGWVLIANKWMPINQRNTESVDNLSEKLKMPKRMPNTIIRIRRI